MLKRLFSNGHSNGKTEQALKQSKKSWFDKLSRLFNKPQIDDKIWEEIINQYQIMVYIGIFIFCTEVSFFRFKKKSFFFAKKTHFFATRFFSLERFFMQFSMRKRNSRSKITLDINQFDFGIT